MKYSRILVKGDNLHNFLNSLVNRNILIKNSKIDENVLIFDVRTYDANKILNLYKKSNYEIEILAQPKYRGILDFFRKNLGIILALIICCININFYTNCIWQYRIYGLENTSQEEVVSALNELGVKKGVRNKSINIAKTESLLLQKLENVALASINIVGTSIIITISEKIDNKEILNNSHQVVAPNDCIITKIITTSGTPIVNIGDKVAKGDIIIDNYVINDGQKIPMKASGEVYADMYYSYSKTYVESEYILCRTNEVYKYSDIDICGMKIRGKNKTSFSEYEIFDTVNYLKSPIPIKLITHNVVKLEKREQLNDLQNIDKLIENTISLGKKHFKLDKIDDTISVVSKGEGFVDIVVTFVDNQKIG